MGSYANQIRHNYLGVEKVMATKICTACNQEFKWEMPYTGKKLNLDGSPHNCSDIPPKYSGGIKETAPIVDSNTIIAECRVFHTAFKEVPDAKFDALARIYISRMMKR